jgi:hypothetical protein
MANSTAPVYFKPTVAFDRGDIFLFGAWVCTADGAGSVQRRLTMPPNPETGFMTLPEVVTGKLAGKSGEVSLFNHHADFELESASNSNSTSSWAIACEPAAQPSQAVPSPRERSARGPCTLSWARTGLPLRAGPARSPYPSTTRTPTPPPATLRTPTLSPSSTRTLITSSTSGRTQRSPSPRTTPLSFPCQGRPLAGYNIHTGREIRLLARPQAYRPDKWRLTLRHLHQLATVPGGNATSPG